MPSRDQLPTSGCGGLPRFVESSACYGCVTGLFPSAPIPTAFLLTPVIPKPARPPLQAAEETELPCKALIQNNASPAERKAVLDAYCIAPCAQITALVQQFKDFVAFMERDARGLVRAYRSMPFSTTSRTLSGGCKATQ